MGFLYDNFIADFFKLSLDFIYGLVNNYGWSIFLLTAGFRIIMLPLDIKTKKNTRKQQALQPKINEINAKYANDKDQQSKKTMELYKQEGFNPMAGCLPLIIQMPIFFAFFGSLRFIADQQLIDMFETIKAGGMFEPESWLWVKNIWQSDNMMKPVFPEFKSLTQYNSFKEMTAETYNSVMLPLVSQYEGKTNGFFILPLLAGVMSYFQMKMAAPATPVQPTKKQSNNPMSGKTMQYMMPFFSVFICITSSAAFALYWATSNLISVLNYFVMNRVFASQDKHIVEIELEAPKSRKMERKLPKL